MSQIARANRPLALIVLFAGLTFAAGLFFVPAMRVRGAESTTALSITRFAPIVADPSSFRAPPDLRNVGTWTVAKPPHQRVGSVDEARPALDFRPLVPGSVPAILEASPTITVIPAGQVSHTIDLAATQAALQRAGINLALPPSLDRATFTADLPVGLHLAYSGTNARLDFYQGRSPLLRIPAGVDVEALRQLVLSSNALPADVNRQILALPDWQRTLPVPTSANGSTRDVPVQGVTGLLVTKPDGRERGLLWQKGGVVFGLGGRIDEATLLAVAAGLRG
ncbi:MAG: hypothetical protein HY329_03495 [Chloroflexi bacterium]|nr:hypothetical protein [Chloroflexota bacterium]